MNEKDRNAMRATLVSGLGFIPVVEKAVRKAEISKLREEIKKDEEELQRLKAERASEKKTRRVNSYLHDELLSGLNAKTVMRSSDEAIRGRADGTVKHGQLASMVIVLKRWLRGGRKVVLLSEAALEALANAKPCLPDDTPLPWEPVEVWFEHPVEIVREFMRDEDKPILFHGFMVAEVNLGAACVMALTMDGVDGMRSVWARDIRTATGHPDDCDLEDSKDLGIIRNILRAMADRRIAWIDPRPKRSKSKAKRERKAGLNVGRLILSDDAMTVWKRKHLAEHERSDAASQPGRAPISPHDVRPHMCRQWVLEPRLGEEILNEKVGREATKGKPAVWLYCVSRQRNGCVRGGGKVKANIERMDVHF